MITNRRYERITIRRTGPNGKRVSCDVCGGLSDMISVEESALVGGIGLRTLFRLLETGSVHFTESPTEPLLICRLSLQKALSDSK